MYSDKPLHLGSGSELNIPDVGADIYFLKGSPGMASIHSLKEHLHTCYVHGGIHKDKIKNTVLAIKQFTVGLER